MTLKYTIDKLEDVAEPLRALYAPNGSKFTLLVEGAVGKDKLEEFRNNNILLQQQIDKFKNIDPAKHTELLELQRRLQEEELIEKGEVEKLVNLRVGKMKTEFEEQNGALTTKLTSANQQLAVLLVDNVVKSAAIAAGIHPMAVDDVLLRARGVYTVADGKPVAKDAEGKTIYGSDGTTPLPPTEWVTGLKKTAPHLFQGFAGGGAGGGGGPAGGGDWSTMSAQDKISLGLKKGTGAPPADMK